MVVDSPESGFLRTLIGGVLGGFIGASMSLSLAGLVFSGAASSGLGLGITGSLLGGAVVAIVSAMKSSHPGVVAGTQDSTAAIIAVAASAAVIQSERAVATTFAMVIVATGAMGVAFWLAGRFHLGRLLHYVPYPVILGFIGATGTVILVGSLAVLGWEVPADTSVALPELIPGALLGVALFAGLRWLTFKYFVPVAMVVTGVAIHWWAAATGDERFSTFLGPFADTAGFRPTAVLQLADADSGGGEFYRSDDGEQWEPTLSTQQNDSPGFDRAVAAGELGFVIVADGVFYSPDAENWVELDISRTRTSVADRSNRVAVGDDIVIGLGGLDGSEGVGATQLLIGRVGGVEADAAFSCPITPLPSEAFTPPDPYVSERGDGMVWYGSDELWTVLQDDGVYVQRKSVWWSVNFPGGVFEEEPEIAVTWERLDAEAAPVTVSPGTNANTFEDGDFMIAGIDPDQSGCWRVTAEYKGATLSYVYERP